MRLLSKVFKDSDIVLENYCLVLDNIQDNGKPFGGAKIVSYDRKPEEILWQAKLKAYKLIENAAEYSNKIIRNADQKAYEELATAQKIGYEEGFKAGKEENEKKMASLISEFKNLIATIEEEKNAILERNETELKDLALNIAKKVVDKELESNQESFLSIYNNAVKHYNGQERLKVIVSEYEAEFMTSNADILLKMTRGAKDIEIQVLENAPQGTCIVETPLSIVDASVETQFNRLKDSMVDIEKSAEV